MAAKSVKDVIAGGKLKRFIDRRLIKALSHPLREHVLAVLNERVASTSEIGREIDLEVSAFYHHVETLEELGFLERVESRRRRGAEEHFFRAKTTMLFDDEAWEKVPPSVRSDMAGSYIWTILDDLVKALRSGAFGASPATHSDLAAGGLRQARLAGMPGADERNAGQDDRDTEAIGRADCHYWRARDTRDDRDIGLRNLRSERATDVLLRARQLARRGRRRHRASAR